LAEVHILFHGYAKEGDVPSVSRVASTVAFVREGDVRVIIDPGMLPDPASLLEALRALGESPASITDVIFSHHHPDHTLNAALFPSARFHDHWAIYQGDTWTDRPAEAYELAPSIRLIETPGHTPQDITTLVGTREGIVAFTHLCWLHGTSVRENDMLAYHLTYLLAEAYEKQVAHISQSQEEVL
jgi:glyoxylase-like metal-dependent hydrolase (beta-lactamase superfamily II)